MLDTWNIEDDGERDSTFGPWPSLYHPMNLHVPAGDRQFPIIRWLIAGCLVALGLVEQPHHQDRQRLLPDAPDPVSPLGNLGRQHESNNDLTGPACARPAPGLLGGTLLVVGQSSTLSHRPATRPTCSGSSYSSTRRSRRASRVRAS